MASAPAQADPCVEAGTRLCNSLEECLLALLIPTADPTADAEAARAAHCDRLRLIIENLYSLLHYHVISLTGKAQCLQVEGILYRHLQLVSCRVVTAYLRRAREEQRHHNNNSSNTNKASGTSADLDREALLSGGLGLDMGDLGALLGAAPAAAAAAKSRPLPTPPSAVLAAWISSLLPDADNQRCYAPSSTVMVPTAAPVHPSLASASTPSPSSPPAQPPSLALQLRRLLIECAAGNSLSATMPISNPSAPFYPHASASGCGGLTEAARRFALGTCRPLGLLPPAAAATAPTQPPAPGARAPLAAAAPTAGRQQQSAAAPQQSVRGRGTATIGAAGAVGGTDAGSAPAANSVSAAQRLGFSCIPDTTFLYVPRMALPAFHSHMLPSCGGQTRASLIVGGGGGSVVAPTGMLVPTFYANYSDRIRRSSGATSDDGDDPTLGRGAASQQALFELSADQRAARARGWDAATSASQLRSAAQRIDVGLRQRHWRSHDPFAAVRDAARCQEDAAFAAEEDEEAWREQQSSSSSSVAPPQPALARRLAAKRGRDIEATYGLLVSGSWLRDTVDEMVGLAAFSDSEASGSASLSALIEECAASLRREDGADGQPANVSTAALAPLFASIERSRAAPKMAALRDPQHVARLSRSLLFTPAVVGAKSAGQSQGDRLWTLQRLYFTRRAPDEGNAQQAVTGDAPVPSLPIEPRALMPVIYRPPDEEDMFSGLRTADDAEEQRPSEVVVDDAAAADDAEGNVDDVDGSGSEGSDGEGEESEADEEVESADDSGDDEVPPPPATAQHIGPQQRLCLAERIAIEFAIRQRLTADA